MRTPLERRSSSSYLHRPWCPNHSLFHGRVDSLGSALYLAPTMSLRPRALPAGFIAPRLPTSAPRPPSGELWLHARNY
jgi:hypothetical protein